VTPWRPTPEQPVPEALHPMKMTHSGAVREELEPMERRMLEKFVQNCLPWVEPHAGAGEECEEEEAAETVCDALTIIPLPRPTALPRGRGRDFGNEVRPGKKGGVGDRCCKI